MNPSTSSTRRRTCVCRHIGFLGELVPDVLRHGQGVEERALLEQHADAVTHAHHLRLGHGVDPLAVDMDGAGIGLQQTKDQLQDDRLSRPARAKQNGHVSGAHRKADVAQHHLVVKGQRHVVERDGRSFSADRRARRSTTACVECTIIASPRLHGAIATGASAFSTSTIASIVLSRESGLSDRLSIPCRHEELGELRIVAGRLTADADLPAGGMRGADHLQRWSA